MTRAQGKHREFSLNQSVATLLWYKREAPQQPLDPVKIHNAFPYAKSIIFKLYWYQSLFRRRFTPERSPTELGLGVAFGLIGAGVFGVVGYYVIKEYRRRIRIRRFLQYR